MRLVLHQKKGGFYTFESLAAIRAVGFNLLRTRYLPFTTMSTDNELRSSDPCPPVLKLQQKRGTLFLMCRSKYH